MSNSYFAEIGGDLQGFSGENRGTINQYFIVQKSGLEIHSQQELKRFSPYLGLEKFTNQDAPKFFGREQWITKLSNHFKQDNILLLLGASGSGKSSLIRAGLIPKLNDEMGSFIDLTFEPDINPFESLYSCLVPQYGQSKAQVAKKEKKDTLVQVTESLKQDSQWIIFIDQFEELFTRTQQPIRDEFVASLCQLINKKDSNIKIVLAMRADFLDRLTPYPALGSIHDSYSYVLTDMSDNELRLTIAEPAAKNGVTFDKHLIDQIISDYKQQPGALPLLQYALKLLWEKEQEAGNISEDKSKRRINSNIYSNFGGVSGALQKQASYIYEKELNAQEKIAAKKIFIELIKLEDKEPVSIRVEQSQFRNKTATNKTATNSALDKLIESRLLVSGRDKSTTVEVAHEELLRSWKFLQDLIQEKREIIILRSRLIDDAKQWYLLQKKDKQKAKAELWGGSKLERVLEVVNEKAFGNLKTESEQFIQASVDRHKEEKEKIQRELEAAQKLTKESEARRIAEKKARQEAERRVKQQAKHNKRLCIGAIMGVLLLIALWQWQNAVINEIETFTESSKALFLSNQELEALIASVKASRKSKWAILSRDTVRTQAETQLREVLSVIQEKNRLEYHDKGVTSVSLSPDGTTIFSASSDDGKLKRWNSVEKKLDEININPDNPDELFGGKRFSPDGTKLVAFSLDGTVIVWDLLWGLNAREIIRKENISTASFHPKGKTIASAGKDRTIQIWDLDSKDTKEIGNHGSEVTKISFHPKGKTIASAGKDGTIQIWDLDSKDTKGSPLGDHGSTINSIIFSPEGNFIASSGLDNNVKLWSSNGGLIKTLRGHQDAVFQTSINSEETILVSSSNDENIKIWDLQKLPEQILKHSDKGVSSISFSRDSKMLVSGSIDGTIKLWEFDGQKFIAKEKEPIQHNEGSEDIVLSVTFSEDKSIAKENFLTSSSQDGLIKRWKLNERKNIEKKKTKKITNKSPVNSPVNRAAVNSVSFCSESELVFASDDGTLKIWNPDEEKLTPLKEPNSNLPIIDVIFSSDCQYIASAQDNGNVTLWKRNSDSFEPFKELPKKHRAVLTPRILA